jgi:hypothetical protein
VGRKNVRQEYEGGIPDHLTIEKNKEEKQRDEVPFIILPP